MKLTSNGKILAILLLVFVFCDFLLSPIGFETRESAILNNASSLPWIGLLFAGLILNIISLILLFFRARVASITAVIGSIIYLAVLLGDQAGLVTSIKAPPLVADVEVIAAIVIVGILFYASRVFRESAIKRQTEPKPDTSANPSQSGTGPADPKTG